MNRRVEFFPLNGGENLVDPVILMKPGELHDSLNYENNTNGGYRRIDGFERFDGHPSPADLLKVDYLDTDAWIVAVEAARLLINPMPGAGAVRGIAGLKGELYGFRDNVAGTECAMYKSTSSGWAVVPMTYRIDFTTGNSEVQEGDVVTGETSGATGTVHAVAVKTGKWIDGDATGWIAFKKDSITGTFQSGENLQVSSTTMCASSSVSYQKMLSPGGRCDSVSYNFYGSSDLRELYVANGVNNAFIFDGENLTYIETGMVDDKPTHIFAHKYQLFLSFPGGSVQHSAPGEPALFNAILGAAEIAIGDECTGFASIPGDTLAIFGRNKIDFLYGTNKDDWNLVNYSIDSGGIAYSIQSMDVPYFLDDRGVKKLSTSMDYGDFSMNTLSQKIKPKLDLLQGKLVSSLRVRNKDQYRMFFNDGSVEIFALDNGKLKGITHCNYGYNDDNETFHPKVFVITESIENSVGEEVLYAGDDDGYIYLLDHGTSFDGKEVYAYIQPVFYHFNSPENIKRFMKVNLELSTIAEFTMTFIPEFSYGDPFYPPAAGQNFKIIAGAGVWDAATWEQFYWDSQSLSTAYAYVTGIGKTFRMVILSRGVYDDPHILQGIMVHYTKKGYNK